MTMFPLGIDTYENKTVWYSTRTNEKVCTVHGTVNNTLLHYYLINFFVNSYFYDPGHSLVNENFPVNSIVNSTFKE